MNKKIFPISSKIPEKYKGCILGFGHFTTIHIGHIRYLKQAKSYGKKLVIALIGDRNFSKPKFQFNQEDRSNALLMLGIVDGILLLEDEELDSAVENIMPEILVLGNEFQSSKKKSIINALRIQEKNGNLIKFHAGDIHYASTDLLNEKESTLVTKRKEQFRNACRRQGIKKDDLINSIDACKDTHLLVIGDTIVDQYAACEALGMSAEAPVVVVRELDHKNFIGGAAVVASHIKALGAKCDLLSIVGDDNTAKLVEKELNKNEIGNYLIKDSSRPTTFKKRYVVENQKLFRVSRLEDHYLNSNLENEFLKKIEEIAPSLDGIVVSDFVYGVITKLIIKKIKEMSKKYNLKLFGDLQCSSQVGNITKFKNFSLLCPNEREARIALQENSLGLEGLSKKLIMNTFCEKLIMKLGSEGFIVYFKNKYGDIISQAFPALSVNPLDVTGAGDSLLAVISTSLAKGQSIMISSALGCCMSALAVETMGNTPISSSNLRSKVLEVMKD